MGLSNLEFTCRNKKNVVSTPKINANNLVMKIKLLLPILTFLFLSQNFCFSQNTRKQLETEITIEIESKIKGLKEEVEAQQMNPFTKNIYSEFAIDTFKIQYFNRRLIMSLKINTMEHLELIKNKTRQYEKLVEKYYALSKKECDQSERTELITAQTSWENFKNKEFNWFSKRFDGSPLDINYYSEYCEIIRQRVLNLYFYYTDLTEH